MSGWLEFFELEIICPGCKNNIEVLFCEDSDTPDPPETKTFLASGKTICPYCTVTITEDEIQFPQSSETH